MAVSLRAFLRQIGSSGTVWTKYSTRFLTSVASESAVVERKTDTFSQHSMVEQLNSYKNTFPEDQTSCSNIDEYITHGRIGNVQLIKLGIKYNNESVAKSSRILEALVAEPLAEGNEAWLSKIAARDRSKNTVLKFSTDANIDEASNTFAIPSSVLSAELRSLYVEAVGPRQKMHDIELVELNKQSEDCILELLVTDSLTSVTRSDGPRVIAVIVDNTEYTPPSLQKTPTSFDTASPNEKIIKIDSAKYMDAVEAFVNYDTKAVDTFVSGSQNSNIYEVGKLLTWCLRPQILQNILLDVMKSSILSNRTEVTNDSLNSVISQFRTAAHAELQQDFEPKTKTFFRRKLPWWKLYFKNDNVEYELKEFFIHNYMNKSIEAYGFTRGRIVTSFHHETNSSEVDNPLFSLKQEIIDHRITSEIQSQVYSIISKAFLYYQLPISAVAFAAYWYFQFTANSALALTSLGVVVGFNYVSKNWTRVTKKWRQALYNDTRECIEGPCQQHLLERLKQQVEQRDHRNSVREATIRSLHGMK